MIERLSYLYFHLSVDGINKHCNYLLLRKFQKNKLGFHQKNSLFVFIMEKFKVLIKLRACLRTEVCQNILTKNSIEISLLISSFNDRWRVGNELSGWFGMCPFVMKHSIHFRKLWFLTKNRNELSLMNCL